MWTKILELILILIAPVNTIFFTNSASNHQDYTMPVNLNMFLPYKWEEHSLRVSLLQKDLNIQVTGIYDEQTRNTHLTYLKNLNVPINNVSKIPAPTQTVTISDNTICKASAAREFAHQILDPYNIPIPSITVIANAKSAFYGPGSTAVFMPPCESKSGIAHEIGHYVHALAFDLNWDAATHDALANFTGTDWIKAEEISPGIEHAAHCIGNTLWGYGAYTKCPDSVMKSYAKEIIQQAGN